jgi:hypothetical protein
MPLFRRADSSSFDPGVRTGLTKNSLCDGAAVSMPIRLQHGARWTASEHRLERIWRKRRSRKKLNAIEDATLTHINARYMAFVSGPEIKSRAWLAELKEKERRFRVTIGPPLTNREQALLFCLSTLYPQKKADCNPAFLAEQSAFSTVEGDDDDDGYPLEYQRAKAPPLADAGPRPRGVGAFRSGRRRRGLDVFGKVAGTRRD